jgi:hypothetical protein
VFIVQLFGILLSFVLDFFFVDPILAFRLSELVDFTTNKASEEFFGKTMADDLAYDRVRCG